MNNSKEPDNNNNMGYLPEEPGKEMLMVNPNSEVKLLICDL